MPDYSGPPMFGPPQQMAPAIPIAPRAPKPTVEALGSRVELIVNNLNRRMRLVEERMDSLREHLELLDNSLVEKHKAATDDVRSLQASLRDLKAEIRANSDMIGRVIKRLDEFASKDTVKILERYLNIWNPLESVNRKEVGEIVEEKLKEKKENDETA